MGRPAARRPRRRGHQGGAAGRRHHPAARPHAQSRHGRLLPRREPQQALDRARSQAGVGAEGPAAARRATPTSSCTTTGRGRPSASACPTRCSVRSTRGWSMSAPTAFAPTGPYADKPAYDDIIQAASGLASLQSALTGEPRFVPTIVADKTSSMTLLAAVLAALYHQARTGEGQEVEVPMFESLAAWIMVEHLYGESFVPPIDSVGYKRVLSPHRKPFKTKDGHLAILPYTDQNWRDFFALNGRQDLLDDPRFKTLGSRLRHIDFLYGELAKIALTRTNAEWLAELDRLNIPAHDRELPGDAAPGPAPGGHGILAGHGARQRGHAAAARDSRQLRQDTRQHPTAAAARRRAQPGSAARGRVRRRRDRRAAGHRSHPLGVLEGSQLSDHEVRRPSTPATSICPTWARTPPRPTSGASPTSTWPPSSTRPTPSPR